MIGKEDHLLRKATVTQSIGDKTMIVTESHSGIKINSTLAANAFAFIPPAGAKPVVSLEPPPADPRLKVGVVPFAFNVKDIKGQPVNLGLYKGRVLLLDFWAMWCKPCVEDLPTVVNAYNKFNKQGFSILGISLDPEGQRNNLIKFAQTHRMPWRHVYDGKFWDSAVARKYGVQAIPFNLLIGRDGKIAAVNVHGPDLAVAISKALAKK
jgi:peroxiredoxin